MYSKVAEYLKKAVQVRQGIDTELARIQSKMGSDNWAVDASNILNAQKEIHTRLVKAKAQIDTHAISTENILIALNALSLAILELKIVAKENEAKDDENFKNEITTSADKVEEAWQALANARKLEVESKITECPSIVDYKKIKAEVVAEQSKISMLMSSNAPGFYAETMTLINALQTSLLNTVTHCITLVEKLSGPKNPNMAFFCDNPDKFIQDCDNAIDDLNTELDKEKLNRDAISTFFTATNHVKPIDAEEISKSSDEFVSTTKSISSSTDSPQSFTTAPNTPPSDDEANGFSLSSLESKESSPKLPTPVQPARPLATLNKPSTPSMFKPVSAATLPVAPASKASASFTPVAAPKEVKKEKGGIFANLFNGNKNSSAQTPAGKTTKQATTQVLGLRTGQ